MATVCDTVAASGKNSCHCAASNQWQIQQTAKNLKFKNINKNCNNQMWAMTTAVEAGSVAQHGWAKQLSEWSAT